MAAAQRSKRLERMAGKAAARIISIPESLATKTSGRRLGRRLVAERIRRPRRHIDAAGDFLGRDGSFGNATHGQRPRFGPDRTEYHRLRHRWSKATIHPQDSQ